MISEEDLARDLALRVASVDDVGLSHPHQPRSDFLRYYESVYYLLLPDGVLFEDIRDALWQAMESSTLLPADDAVLPWIGAHLLLSECRLSEHNFDDFKTIDDSRKFLHELYEKLPEKIDDSHVESLELIFAEKFKGFGVLAAQHQTRQIHIFICVRYYLRLLFEGASPARLGTLLAIIHIGTQFRLEGAAVIKYLERYARPE